MAKLVNLNLNAGFLLPAMVSFSVLKRGRTTFQCDPITKQRKQIFVKAPLSSTYSSVSLKRDYVILKLSLESNNWFQAHSLLLLIRVTLSLLFRCYRAYRWARAHIILHPSVWFLSHEESTAIYFLFLQIFRLYFSLRNTPSVFITFLNVQFNCLIIFISLFRNGW